MGSGSSFVFLKKGKNLRYSEACAMEVSGAKFGGFQSRNVELSTLKKRLI